MAENTLQKIIEKKINKINILKKNITIDSLKKKITENNSFVNFKEKIEKNIISNKISIIAEIKKASPSAGVIIKDYDPLKIAKIYESNKATCLSVLTEEDFFFGNLIHISKIKQKINLPVLCKDFFIDPFQVHLAKSYGADAILIIIAGVNDKLADQLYEEAQKKRIQFCGLEAVIITGMLMDAWGYKKRHVLKYDHSGSSTQNYDSVVGYCSLVYT